MSHVSRRLPVGAEPQSNGHTHFRVWAPQARAVTLRLRGANDDWQDVAMTSEPGGYYSVLAEAGAGSQYRYRLDGEELADPASRRQPDGPFGPSEVVDPKRFVWHDAAWRGIRMRGQVIYELHVGTFTDGGTFLSALDRLPQLREIGITTIEVMPVSEFPGRFGWGYDGVFPYAPTRLYGSPDDFRTFVDRAHGLGLGVILDVVYNHLGPDGCVFSRYSKAYYTKQYENEWGEALNFEDADAGPAREFWEWNGAHWVDEYHLDGLRLDATQSIHDRSTEHIIAALGKRARAAAGNRSIIIVTENEPQDTRMLRPLDRGGYGLDGAWNDDFHHSAIVALTGRAEAYYTDHRGTPQEFISAAKRGYLFQGQRYSWQKQNRGTSTRGIPPAAFVTFLENHDQIANSPTGARVRLRSAPGSYRAMTALMLLMPGTPMLFQGQEFGATTPFHYFADHNPELAKAVEQGRGEFMAQFESAHAPDVQAHLPRPHDERTFEQSKLRWDEWDRNVEHRRLHQDLLTLRRTERAFSAQEPGAVDGAVLGADAFCLRFETADAADDRLLLINLGCDVIAPSIAEPLLAAPPEHRWTVGWSSEAREYGGEGTPNVLGSVWRIPGHAAVVLKAERDDGGDTGR